MLLAGTSYIAYVSFGDVAVDSLAKRFVFYSAPLK